MIISQSFKPEKSDEYITGHFRCRLFWGIQAVFDTVPGVVSTTVGYTGGKTENPGYREVCNGDTGHAEAVKNSL